MKIFIANKRIMLSGLIIGLPLIILTGVAAVSLGWRYRPGAAGNRTDTSTLGVFLNPAATPTTTPTQTPQPTPTQVPYIITLVDGPQELAEGDTVTFTWDVNGPAVMIQTTAVYYGRTSTPETLTRNADPETTQYTGATNDFVNGEYLLPMRFVANMPRALPGKYYFRGYAFIGGKHYWTDEHSFDVRSAPRHEIRIIDYPKAIAAGNSASFTWEISGPDAQTGYTAILAGKESRPGPLETSVTTTMMPYRTIVNDFTQSMTKIPLRFIGNAAIHEPGVYYFRAMAFINDKNIWSDEKTFTVE